MSVRVPCAKLAQNTDGKMRIALKEEGQGALITEWQLDGIVW
jgi:hypothetical protein